MNTKTVEPLTDKQSDCISWICDVLEIEYTGHTKQDATAFIGRHIEKAKREQYQREIYDEAAAVARYRGDSLFY